MILSDNKGFLVGSARSESQFGSFYADVSRLIGLNALSRPQLEKIVGPKEIQLSARHVEMPHDPLRIFDEAIVNSSHNRARSSPEAWNPIWGERPKLDAPIRFCPRCLRDGTHTWAFQHTIVDKCPVHDSELTTCCPCCGGTKLWSEMRTKVLPNMFQCSYACGFDFRRVAAVSGHEKEIDLELAKYREWLDRVRDAFHFYTPFCVTTLESNYLHGLSDWNLLFSIIDACKKRFNVRVGEPVHFMTPHVELWDVRLQSLDYNLLSDLDESDHGILKRWRHAHKCQHYMARDIEFTWLPLLRRVKKWNPDFEIQFEEFDDVVRARIPTRHVPSSVFDWLNDLLHWAAPSKTYFYLAKAPKSLRLDVKEEIDTGADLCIQLNFARYREAVESLLLGMDTTNGGLLDPAVRRFSGVLDCVGHDTLEVHATLSLQNSTYFGER